MATIDITQITGSQFIGSPITVPVKSATVTGTPTFRRVGLMVTVDDTHQFPFFMPVSGNAETVQFDVSSALCAVAEMEELDAGPDTEQAEIVYPKYTIKLTAWDDYMVDGDSREDMDEHEYTITGYFYAGHLTDRERLTGARPARYTRKPTTGQEIVFIGSYYLNPGLTANAETGALIDPDAICVEIKASTRIGNLYPIDYPEDGYELRFINSLGVHDSLCIRCLRTEETSIEQTEYVVAKQETLTDFSRGVTEKENDQEVWQMSSGPLDRAWQSYYIHEVLMAKKAWLKVDGLWLPVHIKPEDTTAGIDRTKASMLEVQFKLKFDITGSPTW